MSNTQWAVMLAPNFTTTGGCTILVMADEASARTTANQFTNAIVVRRTITPWETA